MKSGSPDFLKKSVDKSKPARYNNQAIEKHAGMAELADTYDSGSYAVTSMQVQVLSPAPKNSEVERSWSFLFIQSSDGLEPNRLRS